MLSKLSNSFHETKKTTCYNKILIPYSFIVTILLIADILIYHWLIIFTWLSKVHNLKVSIWNFQFEKLFLINLFDIIYWVFIFVYCLEISFFSNKILLPKVSRVNNHNWTFMSNIWENIIFLIDRIKCFCIFKL